MKYDGNHIYWMVEVSGKIIRHSIVGWINNEVEAQKKHSSEPFLSASKRQRPNPTQEESLHTPETRNITKETLFFADYQLVDQTQDFSHPSGNSLHSCSVSILSFATSSSDSLAPPSTTSINPAQVHRLVAHSQGTILVQLQTLVASDQSCSISIPEVLRFLSMATNSKPIEPNTYKQAIRNQKSKNQDWK